MPIPLQITFRTMESSPALEESIRDGAAKLEAVFPRIIGCHVVVSAPHRHHRQGQRYQVRVSLDVPGGAVIASRDTGADAGHEDPYVAVRDAFLVARRGLEQHAQRLRGEPALHEARTGNR